MSQECNIESTKKTKTGHSGPESFRVSVDVTDVCALSELSDSTKSGLELVPIPSPTTQPAVSSVRPPKRTRDEIEHETISSSDPRPSSSSSSASSSSDPEASSPSKRQKRESADETQDSTPEPVRTIEKRVRFHPFTYDNSLWADLYAGKYKSEWAVYEEESSSVPNGTDSTQNGSAQSSASEEDTEPLPLRPFKSRREISRDRAKAFLARQSWSNHFRFIDRTSDDEPDPDDDTCSSHLESDEDWPEDDLDDVSVPRSSPPPSVRAIAMELPAAEMRRHQAAMEAKRQRDAKVELPSVYYLPLRSMIARYDSRPLVRPIVGDSKQNYTCVAPSREDVSRHGQIFTNTMLKLAAEDARAITDCLEAITRYHARVNFEEGYKEGMRSQQLMRTRETEKTPAS